MKFSTAATQKKGENSASMPPPRKVRPNAMAVCSQAAASAGVFMKDLEIPPDAFDARVQGEHDHFEDGRQQEQRQERGDG